MNCHCNEATDKPPTPMATTTAPQSTAINIFWDFTEDRGHMVCYSIGYGRALAYRCQTRAFGLGIDEALIITEALTMAEVDYETIPAKFRAAKKAVVNGFMRWKAQKLFNRVPDWTPAQLHNALVFAAWDAIEGKRVSYGF